jgi:hypothetical protein
MRYLILLAAITAVCALYAIARSRVPAVLVYAGEGF